MRVRKLVEILTGAIVVLGGLACGGVTESPANNANACYGTVIWLKSDNHTYARDVLNVWFPGSLSQADVVCEAPGAGIDASMWFQYQSGTNTTDQCLTWNKAENYIYDATCGKHPYAQSWAVGPSSNSLEIKNLYGGKCLAAQANTDTPMYLYACAPGGNDANQDWDNAAA